MAAAGLVPESFFYFLSFPASKHERPQSKISFCSSVASWIFQMIFCTMTCHFTLYQSHYSMSLNVAWGTMIDTIWADLSQHSPSAGTAGCFGFMYVEELPSKTRGRQEDRLPPLKVLPTLPIAGIDKHLFHILKFLQFCLQAASTTEPELVPAPIYAPHLLKTQRTPFSRTALLLGSGRAQKLITINHLSLGGIWR